MPRYLPERQQVADTCRLLADLGYFAGTGGNMALRVEDNLFAVTPSATDYAGIGAEDILLLTLDTLEVVEGDKVPTVEKGLHARMLATHPKRHGSIHTHQPIVSAVALLHERLHWPEGSDTDLLGPHAALVAYRPSGTGMLVKALEKALRPDIYTYIMASHGAICVGADLAAAVQMIRATEAAAAHALRTRIAHQAGLDPALSTQITAALDDALAKGALQ